MLKYKKGLINTWDISDGAITTSKIADRAVTNEKISGRLSLSKLPTSSTANRILAVRTANADPVYDKVRYGDIGLNDFPARYIINTRHPSLLSGLFIPIQWYDALMWAQPTVEKYVNGEWQEVSNSQYLRLFSGASRDQCYVVIPGGSTEYLRFTFDIGQWSAGLFLCIHAHVGKNVNGIKVTVEFSPDLTNWTTTLNEYEIKPPNTPPEHGLYVAHVGTSSSILDFRYIRITLKWIWVDTSVNIVLCRIALISQGSEFYTPGKVYAFGWDRDGYLIPRHNATNIGFATSLMPKTDNTYDIGSDTLRWRRVRAVTVSTGDIELANDWRISELDDGVVIKNKDGEEVFRITNDGLWFKGNKIA